MDKPGRLSLNGEWLFKPFYGEDWSWRGAHRPGTRDRLGWSPGRVPGCVQQDLWQNGLVPDPYFEANSLLLEWASERTWVYKRSFTPEADWAGRRVSLVFEGVDYAARFYLNGELLGEHRGMFVPAVFEVGERLRWGEANLLAVVIEPAPREEPQVGYTSRVRTQKARMNYWWDFCPRLVHLGIWDEVYLEAGGAVRLEDAWAQTVWAGGEDHALLRISIELEAGSAQPVEIEAALSLEGEAVAETQARLELAAGRNPCAVELEVAQPRLWWPNGSGAQPLYRLDIRIATNEGGERIISDQATLEVGLRRLRFVPNQGAPEEALPYTLEVNGRRIYIQGWNWVPLDVFYGVERPEKLERLLTLAQRAGVNMLRVWGGGLVEKEAFYRLCDRLGLLVWQEFTHSSSGIENTPSCEADFIAQAADTARRSLVRRRNHACLALWCGGNELQTPDGRPLDESHPLLAALRQAVRELDPGRAWLPSSPSGPLFGNNLENLERQPESLHDVHGPWEHQGLEGQCRLYNLGASLLHSEFGVEGLTNQRTLDRTLAPQRQAPVSLENPLWRHLGAWWVKEPRWREVFGEVREVRELVRAVQVLQAAGLGYAVEANRRRAFRNSGSLPWQFNEPYPMAACTSAVDYYARPKPAYYAVARAYRPLRLSARFPTQAWSGREALEFAVWVCCSRPGRVEAASLELELRGASGVLYAGRLEKVWYGGEAAQELARWRVPPDEVEEELFFLDLRLVDPDGAPLDSARYLQARGESLAPLLAAPAAGVTGRLLEAGDRRWTLVLENSGPWSALFVWLEDLLPLEGNGWAYFDDNHFCLFPGESRRVEVEWQGAPPERRAVQVSGFNFPTFTIQEDMGAGNG